MIFSTPSPEEDRAEEWEAAPEEPTGVLDPEKVAEARREEIGYMKSEGLWEVVPRPEGVVPCSVRWVDVLNAEGITRSRLVARDFKGNDTHRDDLFAATPPLEAFRAVLSRAATATPSREPRKLMLIDAKKAHLNPRCLEDVYIELPSEAEEGPDKCGKLIYWLYGFRKAASEWEKFYAERLEWAGFRRGEGCPVVFHHSGRDISGAVHGDDFVFTGLEADLRWSAQHMEKHFEIKVRAVLGGGVRDDKEAIVLGRTVRWRDWGIEVEADCKHRRLLLEEFGLDGSTSKHVDVNGARDADRGTGDDGDAEDLLTPSDASRYRACVARLNYLGQDSPDVQFPAKELSKRMSQPRTRDWIQLKRTVRYLVGRCTVCWRYSWQEVVGSIRVFTDSDWAGDRDTRKSTSGGVILVGDHCLRTWSTTQGAIALSSAEAEFYAMTEGVLRAKGVAGVLAELGVPLSSQVVELYTDSSAAKSFVSRRGLGRMRHLELRHLWIQREVGLGNLLVEKVAGTENPADVLTKFLSRREIQARLERLGLSLAWRQPS